MTEENVYMRENELIIQLRDDDRKNEYGRDMTARLKIRNGLESRKDIRVEKRASCRVLSDCACSNRSKGIGP
jgi:hypothetical protein